MNLFFDECVSPQAAITIRERTDHATSHPRDMNTMGATDAEVLAYCVQVDHVLVTVNGKDFRKLCGAPDMLHPGLIVIPSVGRDHQIDGILAALSRIEAEAPPETAQDWMVNRVVEVDVAGAVTVGRLPRDDAAT